MNLLLVLAGLVLVIWVSVRSANQRVQRCVFLGALDAHDKVLACLRQKDLSGAERYLLDADRLYSMLTDERAKLIRVNQDVLRQLVAWERTEKELSKP